VGGLYGWFLVFTSWWGAPGNKTEKQDSIHTPLTHTPLQSPQERPVGRPSGGSLAWISGAWRARMVRPLFSLVTFFPPLRDPSPRRKKIRPKVTPQHNTVPSRPKGGGRTACREGLTFPWSSLLVASCRGAPIKKGTPPFGRKKKEEVAAWTGLYGSLPARAAEGQGALCPLAPPASPKGG
jgi:hypothetical protein